MSRLQLANCSKVGFYLIPGIVNSIVKIPYRFTDTGMVSYRLVVNGIQPYIEVQKEVFSDDFISKIHTMSC